MPAEKKAAKAAPRPYHHGNLRDELIRCGKERLKAGPLAQLSLRKIAGDAGVSQVAPKHHFGNKEGLLAAIAASGFRDLTEFRYSRLKPGMNAEQRLRILLSSYVAFAMNNPALFHLMFAPQVKVSEATPELNESSSQSYHLLAGSVADFFGDMNHGAQPGISADEAARSAWACMHGLATLMLEHRINPLRVPRYSREQLVDRSIDLIFAGMRAS